MRPCRRDRLQILDILILANGKLHTAYDVLVLLLKHDGVFAVDRLICRIVFPVIRHLINKEQGENFNAFVKQLALPLEVGKDGFPYLDTPKLILIYCTDHIPGKDLDAVQKFNRIISPVDLLDYKTVSVFL